MENKITYTAEEIQAILTANNLDIKNLAKLAKLSKTDEDTGSVYQSKSKPSTPRTHKKPEFTLELTNYPDFVIRKKTQKTTRDMVFMISQNSYFLKDSNTGAMETLTPELYSKFTTGMDEAIELPEEFWIGKIRSGKEFWNSLKKVLDHDVYREMVKNKVAFKYENANFNKWWHRLDNEELYSYEDHSKLYCEYYSDELLRPIITSKRCIPFLKDMVEKFGMNNTRDFLDSLHVSLVQQTRNEWRGSLDNKFSSRSTRFDPEHNDHTGALSPIPNIKMEYAAFKDYVLFESVRMGYVFNMEGFWQYWNDTLNMQHLIYGKIKNKYPSDLPLLHNKLSYICALKRQEINERMFAEQSLSTQKYEMKIKDWVFLAPRKPDDFYDEAAQQANCLASYVQKYTEGRTHIVFMRKADEPDTSVVTIEYVNGVINQAYQAHNARVTNAQQEILDIWYNKIKKIDAGESIEEEEEVNA